MAPNVTIGHNVTMGYSWGAFVDRTRHSLGHSLRHSLGRTRELPSWEYASVAGARLRVRELGSGGPCFVLSPDPPNVLEHHLEGLERFARRGRAIGLELPGFGHSTPPAGFGFSIGENAEIVARLLDKRRVEHAVLMFPCVSGLVALEVARRRPRRVAAVVLSQTPSFEDVLAWSRRVDPRGLMRTPVVGQLAVRAFRRRLAHHWYDVALPRGVDRRPYVDGALAAYARGADYCLASALQALPQAEVPRTELRTPVLSVWGGADRTHRPSDPRAGLVLAPRSRLVVFDDAGHFPDLEQPERYCDEVLAFVEQEL